MARKVTVFLSDKAEGALIEIAQRRNFSFIGLVAVGLGFVRLMDEAETKKQQVILRENGKDLRELELPKEDKWGLLGTDRPINFGAGSEMQSVIDSMISKLDPDNEKPNDIWASIWRFFYYPKTKKYCII